MNQFPKKKQVYYILTGKDHRAHTLFFSLASSLAGTFVPSFLKLQNKRFLVFCNPPLHFLPRGRTILVLDADDVMNDLVDFSLIRLGNFNSSLFEDSLEVSEVTGHSNLPQQLNERKRFKKIFESQTPQASRLFRVRKSFDITALTPFFGSTTWFILKSVAKLPNM